MYFCCYTYMARKNYYIVLGLQQNATLDDIKKAYRKLAFRYHPDQNKGGLSGEERFREIKEAYEVLIHPQERKKYDATLRAQHIYAPSYDFGKYSQPDPNAPKHPRDFTNAEAAETGDDDNQGIAEELRPWYSYFIKPVIFLLVALLLMQLITNPPLWLRNLLK